MIKPDFAKWGQSLDEMRRLAIEAEHERSRERFQALYAIGSGETTATEWSQVIERQARTVLGWVHNYNQQGVAGVLYQHCGGRHQSLAPNQQSQLVETVLTSTPAVHELPGYG